MHFLWYSICSLVHLRGRESNGYARNMCTFLLLFRYCYPPTPNHPHPTPHTHTHHTHTPHRNHPHLPRSAPSSPPHTTHQYHHHHHHQRRTKKLYEKQNNTMAVDDLILGLPRRMSSTICATPALWIDTITGAHLSKRDYLKNRLDYGMDKLWDLRKAVGCN